MEDRFLVLTTTFEQALADRTCAALEDAGIPVILEHVQISDRDLDDNLYTASGFRVLVPAPHTQTAMRLVTATSSAYYDKIAHQAALGLAN
ncbi:MAG: hypothetical protein RL417_2480 [Pseudomonadota bacterium]|jgi:hypothetical protein